MRLMGGLVSWDEPVGLPALRAMTRSVRETGPPILHSCGSAGLFSSVGTPAFESTPDVLVLADMDLSNVEQLRARTGDARDDASLLSILYAAEGPSFVRLLHGAFAFAIWDRRQRMLLLGVDHVGIRRLYYATQQGRIAFASRPSVVMAAPGMEQRIDLTAVFDYLNFGYVPAPRSIYAAVRRLPPAHLLIVHDGRAKLEPYWDITYCERAAAPAETAATLYDLTKAAVGDALRDTAPDDVGAYLSGGTDSSTVVGLMRGFRDRVNAFSIGFREKQYNELAYAEASARHAGATHYTRIVSANDALDVLPRLVEGYGEPFGNNSSIGTFLCAQLAHERGVSTLLAGDGGDEIFGGNERYRIDRIFARYHYVPAVLRSRIIEPLLGGLGDRLPALVGRAQRYVRRANIPNPRRFYSYEFFVAQQAQALLEPEFRAVIEEAEPYAVLQGHYNRANAAAELNRLLYLDLKLTLGDNDLFKVTRTAELAGVAVRFPLLDPPLMEFTATWPAAFKVRGLEKRYLFKRAFRNLLAPETLAKPKHGFGVPTSLWLKADAGFRAVARDTLLSPRARQRGYFRPGALDKLFEWHAQDDTAYYGDILWTALMLELWHRHDETMRTPA